MGDVGSVVKSALRSAKSAIVENAKQDLRSLRHLRGRAKDWWLNRRVDIGSGRVEEPLPWDEATEEHIWRDAERCLHALGEKSDDTRADSICTYEEGVVDAIKSFAKTAKDCAGDPESWATAELDLKKGNKGPRSQLEEQSVIMMRTALRDRANKKPDESLQHLRNQADNFFNALDKIEGPDGKKLDPEVIRTSRAVLGLIMEACNERLARKNLPPHFLGPKRSKRKQKPEYQKVKDRATKRAFTNFVVEPGLLNALVSGEDPMPMVNKLSDVYRVFGEEKLRVALCLTFRDFRNAKDRNPNEYLKLKPTIDQMGRRAAALLEISKDKPMLRFKAEAMKTVHDAYYLATFPPDKRDLKGVPPLEPPGVADRAWAQIRRAVGPKNPELTCRIYAVVESVLLKNRDVAPIEKLVDFLAWGDTSNIWKPLVAAFGVLPPQDVEHLRIFGATMEIIAQHDLPADTPWRAKAKTLGSVAGTIAHAHHSAHNPDVPPPPWRTHETDYGLFCYQLLVKYAFEKLDDVDTYVKSLKGLLSLAQRDKDAFFAAVDQEYEGRSSSTRATLLEKVRAADAAITSRSDLDYEIYEMSEKILDRLRGPDAASQDVTDLMQEMQPDMENFAPPLVRSEVTIIDAPPLQRGVMVTDLPPLQRGVMVTDHRRNAMMVEEPVLATFESSYPSVSENESVAAIMRPPRRSVREAAKKSLDAIEALNDDEFVASRNPNVEEYVASLKTLVELSARTGRKAISNALTAAFLSRSAQSKDKLRAYSVVMHEAAAKRLDLDEEMRELSASIAETLSDGRVKQRPQADPLRDFARAEQWYPRRPDPPRRSDPAFPSSPGPQKPVVRWKAAGPLSETDLLAVVGAVEQLEKAFATDDFTSFFGAMGTLESKLGRDHIGAISRSLKERGLSKIQVSKIDALAKLTLLEVERILDFSAESKADIRRILSFWADLKREVLWSERDLPSPAVASTYVPREDVKQAADALLNHYNGR